MMVNITETNIPHIQGTQVERVQRDIGIDFFCSIPQERMLAVLSNAQSVISRKTQTLSSSSVQLEVVNQFVTVTGANIDMDIISRTPWAGPEQAHGKIAVMGSMLFDIVRKLDKSCTLILSKLERDTFLSIRAGKSEFHLPIAASVPSSINEDILGCTGLTLSCASCFALLDKVSFAISQDEARQFMCGAYLSVVHNHLRAAATNGHRLAVMSVSLTDSHEIGMQSVIIPRRTVYEVMRHAALSPDGMVQVAVQSNRIIFRFPNTILISKLVDGQYPDFDSKIPERSGARFKVQKSMFANALDRTSSVLLDKDNAVSIKICNDTATVSAQAIEYGSSASEDILIDYRGEELNFSINPRYMLEVLPKINGDQLEAFVHSRDHPVLCVDDETPGFLYIVMPMRV